MSYHRNRGTSNGVGAWRATAGEEEADDKDSKQNLMHGWKAGLENSGLHGITSIFTASSNVRRTCWIILLILFFICAVIHTWATIMSASRRPTHYNFDNKPTKMLPPPDFTVCSGFGLFFNITTLEKNYENRLAGRLRSTGDLVSGPQTTFDLEEVMGLFRVLPDLGLLRYNILRTSKYNLSSFNHSAGLARIDRKFGGDRIRAVDHLIAHYMLPCNVVFTSCAINNVREHLNCCSIFKPVFSLLYGPCYATKMSMINTSVDSQLNYLNDMLITISKVFESDTPPATKNDLLNTLWMYLGLEQFNNKYSTFLPNTHTEMFVDVRHVSDIVETNKCIPAGADNTKLQIFQSYSPERCFMEKSVIHQLGHLDCFWPLFKLMNPKSYVLPAAIPCTEVKLQEIDLICEEDFGVCDLNHKNKVDHHECLPECQRWEYTVSYRHSMEIPDTVKNHDEISLYLSYSSTTYTTMEEVETLTWTDYLSMVGGLWGLWLGSSIITFIHIAVTLMHPLVTKFQESYCCETVTPVE